MEVSKNVEGEYHMYTYLLMSNTTTETMQKRKSELGVFVRESIALLTR